MRGTTPLHAAAGHFSADFTPIIVALLHAGAFVGALDATGRTPLQVCTRCAFEAKAFFCKPLRVGFTCLLTLAIIFEGWELPWLAVRNALMKAKNGVIGKRSI